MPGEGDLSKEWRWFHEARARKVVSSLERKNVNARYVPSRQEALAAVIEMIPEGATINRGDSVTLEQIGAIQELRRRGKNTILDSLEKDSDGFFLAGQEERRRLQREAFWCQVFLTGTNAITLDGKLVNVDGAGNRVSAMIFGPDRVIVVAGVNKIVKDVNEALDRIREVCAPMNARRHYMKHQYPQFADLPCVRTGSCADCTHKWKICHYTVIVDGVMARERGRITVVLVGEPLGI